MGISLALTREYLGGAAEKRLQKAIGPIQDFDATWFTLSNGVSCKTKEKACYITGRRGGRAGSSSRRLRPVRHGGHGAGGLRRRGAGLARLCERMVTQQIAVRGVEDPRVLAALRKVPRHRFVPEAYRARSYDDTSFPWATARPFPSLTSRPT